MLSLSKFLIKSAVVDFLLTQNGVYRKFMNDYVRLKSNQKSYLQSETERNYKMLISYSLQEATDCRNEEYLVNVHKLFVVIVLSDVDYSELIHF